MKIRGGEEREAIYVNPFVGSVDVERCEMRECGVDVLLECLR